FIIMSESRSERLPNVIKEAMYRQCIVISSKSDGIDELIESGQSGFIIEHGDVRAASDTMRACIVGDHSMKLISMRAKKLIEEKFNITNSMKKYLEKWSEIKYKNI